MKPSRRGCSGSPARAASSAGARAARGALREAGEVDQDRARQVAQADLAGERRQISARLASRWTDALAPRAAVSGPRSTSIATSAGVGWTEIVAPPGRRRAGSARAATARARPRAARRGRCRPVQRGRSARPGGHRRPARRRPGAARRRRCTGEGRARSAPAAPRRSIDSAGRRARQARTLAALGRPGDAHGDGVAHRAAGVRAVGVGQEALGGVPSATKAPAIAGTSAVTRPRWSRRPRPARRGARARNPADVPSAPTAATRPRPGRLAIQDAVVTAARPAAAQQLGRLEQRQADHVGVAAGQEAHESRRVALDRHSRRPCRAIRRWRGRRDLRRGQPGEGHGSRPAAAALRPSGRAQHDGGQHAVAAAGQQRQAGARLGLGLRLGQDAPAGRDDRVGGQHEAAGRSPPRRAPWRAPGAARGRAAVRRGAGVSSMSAATTRSGVMPICASRASRRGLAEARISGAASHRIYLKRKVIRPLVRS